MIFFINIVAFTFSGIIIMRRSFRRGEFVNFSVLSWIVFGIIFLLTPLLYENEFLISNEIFNGIVGIGLITLVFSLFFIKGPTRICQKRKLRLSKVAIYIIVGIVAFRFVLTLSNIASQGLSNYFLRDRTAERLSIENYYSGKGFLEYVDMVFIPLLYIMILTLIRSKTRTNKLIGFVILIFMVFDQFLSSLHRTPVVNAIIVIFLLYHFFFRRIRVYQWLIPIVIAILIMGYGAYFRAALYNVRLSPKELVRSSLSGFYTSPEAFNLYYEVEYGDFDLELGIQYFYFLPASFIPKRLWVDKPLTSFEARMTQKYYRYTPAEERQNYIHTFTIIGEGYSQFGLFGVILSMILYVIRFRWYFIIASRLENSELYVFTDFLKIPIGLRASLSFFLVTFIVDVLAFLIISILFYKRYSNPIDNSVLYRLSG